MTDSPLVLNDTARSGTGLLAIYCDLAPKDQADFRPWLVEDMFPARMKIGFNGCASFDRLSGTGPEFVTMYEMPSLGHLYGEPYQALRRVRNPRDAAYHEKFQNPERYTLSWAGPELSSDTSGFTPYVAVDRFELAVDKAQSFNIWFVCTYLRALAKLSGVVRVRRYLSMEGTPSHFVLHEISNASVVESSAWSELRGEFRENTSGLYQRVVEAY